MKLLRINKITKRLADYFKRVGQVIADRWRMFRAWQEHPISYRMDEEEHVCNNCGHTFRGNYCPVCSQSARHGRITWLAIYCTEFLCHVSVRHDLLFNL